jgi:choline dehydrogenase-like flavoprotein
MAKSIVGVPPRRVSRDDMVMFIRRFCMSFLHPVGTCAMGSGEEAVVDVELRVHGIESLRIAGAMPTIPRDCVRPKCVLNRPEIRER